MKLTLLITLRGLDVTFYVLNILTDRVTNILFMKISYIIGRAYLSLVGLGPTHFTEPNAQKLRVQRMARRRSRLAQERWDNLHAGMPPTTPR